MDAPEPKPSEALVDVRAISLNRGEVRNAMAAQNQYVPGWDLAGVVAQAAADGSGPRQGARVVGLHWPPGAWAEQVAVPTDQLAELPEEVSFEMAATLPVAGLTAMQAVNKGGNLAEKAVLVTGASGGVGLFAIELARLSGARVVGSTRQATHEGAVRQAGADEVVTGEDVGDALRFGPYDLICDGVGGPVLARALPMLARGGIAVTYGHTTGQDMVFNNRQLFTIGGASLYGLWMHYEFRYESAAIGLERLAHLIAKGRLHPQISVRAPWTDIGKTAQRLMERDYTGKAVLFVGEAGES